MDAYKNEIKCIGKDSVEKVFKYSLRQEDEDGYTVLYYNIKTEDLTIIDWFDFTVTIIDNETARVTNMSHHYKDEYIAKGIPDVMIEVVAVQLKCEITSSSNKKKILPIEWRSPSATKVWGRLASHDKAKYDEDRDVFVFTGK
jgi:hypothetical protein